MDNSAPWVRIPPSPNFEKDIIYIMSFMVIVFVQDKWFCSGDIILQDIILQEKCVCTVKLRIGAKSALYLTGCCRSSSKIRIWNVGKSPLSVRKMRKHGHLVQSLYRSIGIPPKKVKCIETGKIFESTRAATHWLEYVREVSYCNMNSIKRACRKKGTCFGYHWEFVE